MHLHRLTGLVHRLTALMLLDNLLIFYRRCYHSQSRTRRVAH